MESLTINHDLNSLQGLVAWAPSRTHGSMFFLDFGDAVPVDSGRNHGAFHFIFESCHWRFRSTWDLLVASEDDQSFIDKTFEDMQLGQVESATFTSSSGDLCLRFNSGIILETFSASSRKEADWKQWIFFVPNDFAWTKKAAGAPIHLSIHEA